MSKKGRNQDRPSGPAVISNRKGRYDYEIVDTYEAGLALVGSEVKSLFLGHANLVDAYCRVINTEMWLMSLDIEPYSHSTSFVPERRRDRKLLLHRKQIDLLERKSQEKGLAIIPLKIYFKNGKAKVEIGLGRGKKQYDKREQIAKKDARREREREASERH